MGVDFLRRVDHEGGCFARHTVDQGGEGDGRHDFMGGFGKRKMRLVARDGDIAQRR
ncbi:hypothetical protein D3C83_107310 [compost metagenome]